MYESDIIPIMIGQLIGAFFGGLIGCLIGAILLRAASHWVVKLDVPFGKAYWTVFIAFIVNFILGYFLGFVAAFTTGSTEVVDALSVIMLPVGFLIQSGIIGSRLKLSFGKACLVNITMIGIALGIAFAIGIFIFLLMTVTGSW